MTNKLVVLTLGFLACLVVAYHPTLAEAKPNFPNFPDLPDVDSPNPNLPNPDAPNLDAPNPDAPDASMLPGESYEEWAKRVHPELSLQGYESAREMPYDPDSAYQEDWDLDGLPDNHPRDRIYGKDRVPDPDPDPDPITAAEETTQAASPRLRRPRRQLRRRPPTL